MGRIGDCCGRHGQGRAGEKPAGKRLASDTRHRVDTDLKPKGLPPHDGGKERGSGIEVKAFGPCGPR